MNDIERLLDIEKDFRECEKFLRLDIGRNMSFAKNSGWFDLMEKLGFLVNKRFLPIIDIINKTKELKEKERFFTLEAVACDLGLIANINH
jgi:hypothetical protein